MINNRLLTVIIAILIAFVYSCNQDSSVTITGTISNQVNDSIVISGPSVKKTIRLDKNGDTFSCRWERLYSKRNVQNCTLR